MPQITLIGVNLAEAGKEFYFEGPNWKCQGCKLKNVCFNLEKGSRYRIVEIRNQKHECPDFEGDSVVVVNVEKIPSMVSIPKKQAIEGGVITFQEIACNNIGCENYPRCRAYGKQDGQKYRIVRICGDVDCPNGEKIVAADII